MDPSSEPFEIVAAGETANVENVTTTALSLRLLGPKGSHVQLGLLPGQVIGLCAGEDEIRIILQEGDPADLLVIKPETAS